MSSIAALCSLRVAASSCPCLKRALASVRRDMTTACAGDSKSVAVGEAHMIKPPLGDVSCVGCDGALLTSSRAEQDADYKDYYEHHKPSPLSEIEVADTRKPITRAIDGGDRGMVGDDGAVAKLVQDTVDEALERAERMWREAATRGDPDSPQSRALARLLARRAQNNNCNFQSS